MKRNVRKTSAQPGGPFPYARMQNKPDALDRLDLRFRWGGFGIRVLRCHLTFFPPGQIISFHKHSEFEFHFIPKGKGKVILVDEPFDLHEGMFYITGPDVVHYQESDAEDPMYELCFHCEIVELGGEEAEWGEDHEAAEAKRCVEAVRGAPPVVVMDRYHAMNAFLDAYRTWEEQPLGFYTQMKQAMLQILLRSARVFERPERDWTMPERDMNYHRYELATQYIQDNAGSPISLEIVAESLNVSPRQLQRIFRGEGGTTFREYLEHVRLNIICSELLRTDRPIEEIALENGYANPNYLFPVFKNKFGVTPSAYRKLHASDSKSGNAH